MSDALHIANGEAAFLVLNIAPDFCVVQGNVVPFEISRALPTGKAGYSKTVTARGTPVLMVDSVIQGVDGNAGAGVSTGVSLATGNITILTGETTVLVEKRVVCRHDDLCWMNGPA